MLSASNKGDIENMADKYPQVAVSAENYEFVATEARRTHRTIKGQIEFMLEIAKESMSEKHSIYSGNSQFNMGALRK
jgi:hypothetical protein